MDKALEEKGYTQDNIFEAMSHAKKDILWAYDRSFTGIASIRKLSPYAYRNACVLGDMLDDTKRRAINGFGCENINFTDIVHASLEEVDMLVTVPLLQWYARSDMQLINSDFWFIILVGVYHSLLLGLHAEITKTKNNHGVFVTSQRYYEKCVRDVFEDIIEDLRLAEKFTIPYFAIGNEIPYSECCTCFVGSNFWLIVACRLMTILMLMVGRDRTNTMRLLITKLQNVHDKIMEYSHTDTRYHWFDVVEEYICKIGETLTMVDLYK